MTAEREEAILRADRAEHQMHLLADQRNTLLEQLEAAQSAPAGHFTTSGSVSTASSENAPPKNTSTAGFGPAPESVSGDTADLTAQVAQLTEQLEEIKGRHSVLEADLRTAQNELADQESSTAQVKFYLYDSLYNSLHASQMSEACRLIQFNPCSTACSLYVVYGTGTCCHQQALILSGMQQS